MTDSSSLYGWRSDGPSQTESYLDSKGVQLLTVPQGPPRPNTPPTPSGPSRPPGPNLLPFDKKFDLNYSYSDKFPLPQRHAYTNLSSTSSENITHQMKPSPRPTPKSTPRPTPRGTPRPSPKPSPKRFPRVTFDNDTKMINMDVVMDSTDDNMVYGWTQPHCSKDLAERLSCTNNDREKARRSNMVMSCNNNNRFHKKDCISSPGPHRNENQCLELVHDRFTMHCPDQCVQDIPACQGNMCHNSCNNQANNCHNSCDNMCHNSCYNQGNSCNDSCGFSRQVHVQNLYDCPWTPPLNRKCYHTCPVENFPSDRKKRRASFDSSVNFIPSSPEMLREHDQKDKLNNIENNPVAKSHAFRRMSEDSKNESLYVREILPNCICLCLAVLITVVIYFLITKVDMSFLPTSNRFTPYNWN